MSDKPVAAGKSSFDLIDSDKLFETLDIPAGAIVLDLACGIGKYATELATKVGTEGKVYAVDLWQEGIEHLDSEAQRRDLGHIETLLADIREPLPLETDSIDLCLLATILHDLSPGEQERVIKEASRLLKPGGTLAIVEFKKLDHGPGPRIDIRLDAQQLETLLNPNGFTQIVDHELGEFTYLLTARNAG